MRCRMLQLNCSREKLGANWVWAQTSEISNGLQGLYRRWTGSHSFLYLFTCAFLGLVCQAAEIHVACLKSEGAQTMWQRRDRHHLDGFKWVVTGCHHGWAQDIHVIFKISDQGGGMPKRVQREAIQSLRDAAKLAGPYVNASAHGNPCEGMYVATYRI